MKVNYNLLFSTFGLFILVQSGQIFCPPQSFSPKTSSIEDRLIKPVNSYNELYVDLSRSHSNIAEIIAQLKDLDEQNNSLIHQLHEHIKNGFYFAEYDSVLETLEYAKLVLRKNYDKFNNADARQMTVSLNEIIDNVVRSRK